MREMVYATEVMGGNPDQLPDDFVPTEGCPEPMPLEPCGSVYVVVRGFSEKQAGGYREPAAFLECAEGHSCVVTRGGTVI
jgi:hypothetical protein